MEREIPVGAEFSVRCRACGITPSIGTLIEARRLGWACFEFRSDIVGATYEGDCPACRIPRDVPFTIACYCCDRGMEIGSFEEAIAESWLDIEYAPEMSMAYFLGMCPDCQEYDC